MLQAIFFVVAVILLGIVGVVGIYIKFLTVLVSLFLACLKAVYEAVVARAFDVEPGNPQPLQVRKGGAA